MQFRKRINLCWEKHATFPFLPITARLGMCFVFQFKENFYYYNSKKSL